MCYPRKKPQPTPEERFWPRVNKTDTCWLWTGAHYKGGYGTMYFHGREEGAHRISWQLAYGPIPDGMWVLHKCDVRNCVNPDHLFLSTRADNIRDMCQKGRSHRGEAHHRSRLTDDDVREIRSLWRAGGLTQGEISRRFGVNNRSISNIVLGKSWSHVT